MKELLFTKLEKQFSEKSKHDKMLREQVKRLVSFDLKSIWFTPRSVVLVAENKAMAQELFFKKPYLERELKREIVIR